MVVAKVAAPSLDPGGAQLAADSSQGRLLVVIAGRPGGWLPDGWPVKVCDLQSLTDEQPTN